MRIVCCVIIFCIFHTIAIPQSQFRFRHITTNEGLSQNSVHAVFQDKEGFLWFGTQDGLNRFDGISFKVFKHSNSDSTSISDSYILSITEDSSNNLWIGTRNGANRFNKKTETFARYLFPEMFNFTFHQKISEIFVDRDGNVLMILPKGLYSFSPRDNFSTPTLLQAFTTGLTGIQIVQDGQNNFWMTTLNGVYCFNNKREEHFYPFSRQLKMGGLLALRGSDLWISSASQLMTFSVVSRTFDQFALANKKENNLQTFLIDSHNRIWVATEENIILLTEISPGNFQHTFIHYNEKDKFSLNDVNARCIIEDNSGLFCIGTMHGGVNVYDPLQSQFKTIDESMMKTLPTVWAVCEDARKIFWFGTSNGLVKAIRKDTSRVVTT